MEAGGFATVRARERATVVAHQNAFVEATDAVRVEAEEYARVLAGSIVHVTITYQEPTSSPLMRWLVGETYTTTAEASSWSQ